MQAPLDLARLPNAGETIKQSAVVLSISDSYFTLLTKAMLAGGASSKGAIALIGMSGLPHKVA